MNAIKITGRNCREMADEAAKIVGKSVHYNLYANRLEFSSDDAAELAKVLEDAEVYWKRMGKRAKSQAASLVASSVREVIISDRYARSF